MAPTLGLPTVQYVQPTPIHLITSGTSDTTPIRLRYIGIPPHRYFRYIGISPHRYFRYTVQPYYHGIRPLQSGHRLNSGRLLGNSELLSPVTRLQGNLRAAYKTQTQRNLSSLNSSQYIQGSMSILHHQENSMSAVATLSL